MLYFHEPCATSCRNPPAASTQYSCVLQIDHYVRLSGMLRLAMCPAMRRRGAAVCFGPCCRITSALHRGRQMSHQRPSSSPAESHAHAPTPGLPRRHGGSDFDLPWHGGSHDGDGSPADPDRSYRAGSDYEGKVAPLTSRPCLTRATGLRACCICPPCRIVCIDGHPRMTCGNPSIHGIGTAMQWSPGA